MPRYIFFALLLLLQPVRAAELDPQPIDAVVEKALAQCGAPGAAVVIVKHGKVIYLKGFGVRERGRPEKVTPDTVFAIASCTKAFTATALAMLVEEGKLKWDDKVHQHLDYFRLRDELADREVTIRDLLCHRTGMPRHDLLRYYLPGSDSEAIIRRWVKAQPSTSLRSTWEYSNVPFTTAGVIAGKIEGTDFAGVIQKRIFDPLGMTGSSCSWRVGSSRLDHATPHYYAFDESITPVQWNEYESGGGAGVIDSSARDLARWLRFQLAEGKFEGKQLLSARALRETHTPQMLTKPDSDMAKFVRFASYGLGWQVHDYRGVTCVTHGGSHTGFRARCALVPEKELGMFVLCNMGPSSVCDVVSKTALDTLLGLPEEDWVAFHKSAHDRSEARIVAARAKREAARKPDTKPTLPLEAYTGGYEEPAYGRIEMTLEDGQLVGRWGKYTVRLAHYHFDTFTAELIEPPDAVVSADRQTYEWHFRLAASGEVESLKGFGGQQFKKAAK